MRLKSTQQCNAPFLNLCTDSPGEPRERNGLFLGVHRLSGCMGHVCVDGLGPRCTQTVRAYGACL